MNCPLVSICLPTYNYAHYLPQVIESCLAQTYQNIELIIIDDASADNSRQVVESFTDSRIHFEVNTTRLGLVGNWNKTLSLVSGEIIKFIFADDYLADDAITKFVQAFNAHTVDLVFCASQAIDAKDMRLEVHQPYSESRYLSGRAEFKRCLIKGNYIGSPSVVALKTRALARIGNFSDIGFHADQDMWLRVLFAGDAYFIHEPLAFVRQHKDSETSRLMRTGEAQKEALLFMETWLRNENACATLSKSEFDDFIASYEAASLAHVYNNVKRGAYLDGCQTFLAGAWNARALPYIGKALHRTCRKLVAID